MTNNKMFSLPNIMNKALEASWKRQEVLADNISNIDTPKYKRKDINFEKVLFSEVQQSRNIHSINTNNLNGTVTTPYSSFATRLDGNNVDIDWEMAEISKNKIKYDALSTQTARHLQRIKSVISNIR